MNCSAIYLAGLKINHKKDYLATYCDNIVTFSFKDILKVNQFAFHIPKRPDFNSSWLIPQQNADNPPD